MKTSMRILLLCAALVWAASAVQGAPRLTMDESTFDFGFTPQNSTISHVFLLRSTGDDTLRILSVKPG